MVEPERSTADDFRASVLDLIRETCGAAAVGVAGGWSPALVCSDILGRSALGIVGSDDPGWRAFRIALAELVDHEIEASSRRFDGEG